MNVQGLLSFAAPFLRQLEQMDKEHDRRINNLIDAHWDATKLPRKKKKAVRKKVWKEYCFEISIKQHFDNLIGI